MGELSAVRVLAPAKVNPTLHVLGRRADGLHQVDLTLLALELADELVARRTAGGVTLSVGGPLATADVPADATNLAARAAAAALEAAGGGFGVALELTKNVPSRAGLGGGSSDAAAAWRAVEALAGRALDAGLRHATLAALGADCVFFGEAVETGFARGTGTGTTLDLLPPLDAPWHVAIVTPSAPCPTGAIYAALGAAALDDEASLSGVQDPATVHAQLARPASDARAVLHNDLEPAALEAVPELRAWRAMFARTGDEAFRLSGSGSSFFAPFDDAAQAVAAVQRVTAGAREAGLELRGAWVTRPVSRLAPPAPLRS